MMAVQSRESMLDVSYDFAALRLDGIIDQELHEHMTDLVNQM